MILGRPVWASLGQFRPVQASLLKPKSQISGKNLVKPKIFIYLFKVGDD
jgi:hypothetical protein